MLGVALGIGAFGVVPGCGVLVLGVGSCSDALCFQNPQQPQNLLLLARHDCTVWRALSFHAAPKIQAPPQAAVGPGQPGMFHGR